MSTVRKAHCAALALFSMLDFSIFRVFFLKYFCLHLCLEFCIVYCVTVSMFILNSHEDDCIFVIFSNHAI